MSAVPQARVVVVDGIPMSGLLAEADGPDNLLREHAFHATLAAPNHAFDRDSDPDEQTGRLAYFTRFDVAGEQLAGQFVGITSAEREPAQLAARRIAADRHGRVVADQPLQPLEHGLQVARLVLGNYYEYKPRTPLQAQRWTPRSRVEGLVQMAALVDLVAKIDLRGVRTPTRSVTTCQ